MDIRTLFIINIGLCFIISAVMISLWRQTKKHLQGVSHFAASFLLQMFGVLLIALRGYIPDWVSIIPANFFLIAGTMACYIGLELFVGKKGSQIHNALLLLAFTVVHTYYTIHAPSLIIRNLNISAASFFVYLQCAVLLLYRVPPARRAGTRVVAVIFCVYIFVSILRILAQFVFNTHPGDLYRSGMYEVSIIGVYGVLLISQAFALALMVNKRLLTELHSEMDERRLAVKGLRASEERYRSIIKDMTVLVFRCTKDGTITFVNDAFRGYFNKQKTAVEGGNYSDFLPSDLRAIVQGHYRFLTIEQPVVTYEYKVIGADGALRWLQWTDHALFDERGGLFEYQSTGIDITEAKVMRDSIEQQNRLLTTILETIPAPVCWNDVNGLLYGCNSQFSTMFAAEHERIVGRTISDIAPVDIVAALNSASRVAVVSQQKHVIDIQIEVDGKAHDFMCHTAVLPKSSPLHDTVVSVFMDITAHRNAERYRGLTAEILSALNRPDGSRSIIAEIMRLLQQVTGFGAVGIRLKQGDDYPYFKTSGFSSDFIGAENRLCAVDAAGVCVTGGDGLPMHECMCGVILDGRADTSKPYISPGGSFWTNSTTELLSVLAGEQPNTRLRNRCNTEGYESVALIPIRYGAEVVGLLQLNDNRKQMLTADMIRYFEETATSIGIALARHRMEAALQESQIIFDKFMEFSPIYVFFKDENIRSLRLSRNYEKMLNRPLHELLGKSSAELFPSPLSEKIVADDKRVLLDGIPVEVEEEFAGRTYRTIKFPITLEGKPPLLAGFTIDVTEQQQAGRALIQADKLKSLGILTSGIAHELNQPLAAMALSVDVLSMKKADNTLHAEFINEKLVDMDGYIERMRMIIDELRMFTHDQQNTLVMEPFDVNDAVRGILSFIGVQYREHALRLTVTLADGLPRVLGNRYKLEQAILNIVTNARDAVEEKAAMMTRLYSKSITIKTKIDGGNVEVRIVDNGIGMTEEVQRNIFTPFFTSKQPGHGTGLGMPIAYGIVQAMKGSIDFRSRPGVFSVFRILLPGIEHEHE
ncbi:MAG: PAS domain S-box protein [Spirochaetes bacterium]|nr:PAS domain S-box protein [Spirochaetota bacterium]